MAYSDSVECDPEVGKHRAQSHKVGEFRIVTPEEALKLYIYSNIIVRGSGELGKIRLATKLI